MARTTPACIIALAMLAVTAAGCTTRSQVPSYAGIEGDDDTFCKSQGATPGSTEFANCLKNRDVQRSNAIVRADRSQRRLGEYMLNNNDAPGYMAR